MTGSEVWEKCMALTAGEESHHTPCSILQCAVSHGLQPYFRRMQSILAIPKSNREKKYFEAGYWSVSGELLSFCVCSWTYMEAKLSDMSVQLLNMALQLSGLVFCQDKNHMLYIASHNRSLVAADNEHSVYNSNKHGNHSKMPTRPVSQTERAAKSANKADWNSIKGCFHQLPSPGLMETGMLMWCSDYIIMPLMAINL